jgi:hypothetical protein
MSILDDENILIGDVKSNLKKHVKLIWDCKDHPASNVLDIIKNIFHRDDLSKDLRWVSSRSNNNIYFLEKDCEFGSSSHYIKPILKVVINNEQLKLSIMDYDIYYLFDMNSHRVLDMQKEFINWIWDLGFDSQKYYFENNCRVFYFNP